MPRSSPAFVALGAVAVLLLSGCAATADTSTAEQTTSAGDGSWPRTISHEAGETTIASEPLRIVSISPSITGSLLAINAPVAASAATTPSGLTDDSGFFTQWADVATERGVEVAYGDLSLDVDAVDLLEPDLIIGSANGGDATIDAYDQLSEIAPTVMLDYGSETWQELTDTLGEITGHESDAEQVVADYDTWVSEQAAEIALPEQPVTALVYLGADGVWAFGASSPQAELLSSLGFDYASPDAEYVADQQAGASGVDVVSSENIPDAFAGSATIFTVAMGGADAVEAFTADPLTSTLPAVTEDRVFSLGSESFRLDYYSAVNTVELLVAAFSK